MNCGQLLIALGLWSCIVGGCGYRPVSETVHQTGDLSAVYLSHIENQTAYRDIAGPLTIAMRHHFAVPGIRLDHFVQPSTPVLTIQIFDIFSQTGAMTVSGKQPVPVNREWQIHAMVTLKGADGEPILGPTVVSVSDHAPIANSITAGITLSSQLRQQLLEHLAREIALKIVTHHSERNP